MVIFIKQLAIVVVRQLWAFPVPMAQVGLSCCASSRRPKGLVSPLRASIPNAMLVPPDHCNKLPAVTFLFLSAFFPCSSLLCCICVAFPSRIRSKTVPVSFLIRSVSRLQACSAKPSVCLPGPPQAHGKPSSSWFSPRKPSVCTGVAGDPLAPPFITHHATLRGAPKPLHSNGLR